MVVIEFIALIPAVFLSLQAHPPGQHLNCLLLPAVVVGVRDHLLALRVVRVAHTGIQHTHALRLDRIL
jgi:hypothetical protein